MVELDKLELTWEEYDIFIRNNDIDFTKITLIPYEDKVEVIFYGDK